AWAKDPASDESKAKPGGAVVLAMLADPDSLNPYLSTYADVEDVHKLIYPQLMHEGPDYSKKPPEFTPYAAESWEFSDGRHVLTFHLRKDMVWSDGEPVTADDVRFSWETAKNADVAWTGGSIKDF